MSETSPFKVDVVLLAPSSRSTKSSIGGTDSTSEAGVDSVVPGGVIVILSSSLAVSLAEACLELVDVVLFAPPGRRLSKSLQFSGSSELFAEHATEALVHGVAPASVVVIGAGSSVVCYTVALVDVASVVFFTPLSWDGLSILVTVVERSPKTVVDGSVPSEMVIALSVCGVVSLSKAGVDKALIVFFSPRGWCSSEDVSCSNWGGGGLDKASSSWDGRFSTETDGSDDGNCAKGGKSSDVFLL